MHNFLRKIFCVCLALSFNFSIESAAAYTLSSTKGTFNGTGLLVGPGPFDAHQELFEMQLKNIAFTNRSDFIVVYNNNGGAEPNVCAEYDLEVTPDGKLSNGVEFSESADMCLANIAGTDMHIAVVKKGPLQGKAQFMIIDKKNLLVTMDIIFDLGIGEKGIVSMPFYGTTGRVQIPQSLQTQLGMPGGSDRAGTYESGAWLEGRFGDFDNDSFIDGTLVSVGNIPLESPVFPGQPYAMIRHFVLDIPVAGHVLGNVSEALKK